jgi:cytochrome oxidase Cu insertion factor (SCO1/SenC/PrrC family)
MQHRRTKGPLHGPVSRLALALAAGFALGLTAAPARAQTPEPTPPLEIGAVAPDFELPGATRFGTLQNPVRLSDFKGKTVVLAFFFRARTPG